MDKRTAKRWTIQIWSYLQDHPEITLKSSLPNYIKYYKNKNLSSCLHECPLCELLKLKDTSVFRSQDCSKCPLYKAGAGCLEVVLAPYDIWANTSFSNEARSSAAGRIVSIVRAWKV